MTAVPSGPRQNGSGSVRWSATTAPCRSRNDRNGRGCSTRSANWRWRRENSRRPRGVSSGRRPRWSDPKAKAEAYHNAYQAALERHAWDEALAALRKAVTLAAVRLAFSFSKYEPKCILGAGGFGVVFLCQQTHLNKPLVVKSLTATELDRDVAKVFDEARVLEALDHPAIIRLKDCDYADAWAIPALLGDGVLRRREP